MHEEEVPNPIQIDYYLQLFLSAPDCRKNPTDPA